MSEVTTICARLIARGFVPRAELPLLDHPAVRADVESRLAACGLELAMTAYSDHVGLRLRVEASSDKVMDTASNLGLGAHECALLTILWARLALQRRTAEDTRSTPDPQSSLLPEEQKAAAVGYTPSVRFETLYREFGAQFGGKTSLQRIVAHLKRLGFVKYRQLDAIEAGPLLELGIDGERMIAFIRTRVLAQLVAARSQTEAEDEPARQKDAADLVVDALRDSAEPLSISVLETRTALSKARLRSALERLRAEGRVVMTGVRAHAVYSLGEG